jgi:hypothetical protein
MLAMWRYWPRERTNGDKDARGGSAVTMLAMSVASIEQLDGRELDAAVEEHVFGNKVTWRWCEWNWNPSGESWWDDAEDYLDYLAEEGRDHKLEKPSDIEGRIVPVLPNWREHPEDYWLEWMPCPDQTRDDGSVFWFSPVAAYSTDIEAAWKVIERMQHDDCDFVLEKAGTIWYANTFGVTGGSGDTAPLAICRAALLLAQEAAQ